MILLKRKQWHVTRRCDVFRRCTRRWRWRRYGRRRCTTDQLAVTDQLGTPRMIIDHTGSLANVKRHDYLPFGEELIATQGLRTSGFGYAVGDGVRQKFTQKERDSETGLDYFLARYYSPIQGTFTSPNEFTGGPDEHYDFHSLPLRTRRFTHI